MLSSLRSAVTAVVATTGAGLALVVAVPSGSAGAAPPECQGQPATIVADRNGDEVQGTPGPDVILTLDYANVTVRAGDGDDIVCGGSGFSGALFGEGGEDTLAVVRNDTYPDEPFSTTLTGGPGKDRYAGDRWATVSYADAGAGVSIDGAGSVVVGAHTETSVGIRSFVGSRFGDRFVGTRGADTYVTGDGRDDVRTGAGNDVVMAEEGSTVHLGAGDDYAEGYDAVVYGEGGNDQLSANYGGTLEGGPGNDRLDGAMTLRRTTSHAAVPEFRLAGGPGNDYMVPVISYEDLSSPSCERGAPVCSRGLLTGGPGVDTLGLPSGGGMVDLRAGRVRVRGGRAAIGFFEKVRGSSERDVLRGDHRRNHLTGQAGNDVLVGRGGADVLWGGPDRDRADGGAGRDRCQAEVRRSC